jgi:AcrR family transcriptional regulator
MTTNLDNTPSMLVRQKLERRQAVLSSAKALIKKQGYEQTTMEGLAKHAGLSTQTVYNYFGTKIDVLMELYVEDRDIAYAKILQLVQSGPADPVERLLAIMTADMHREGEAVSHELWRQVASAEITHLDGKHHETFSRMNERYRKLIIELMKRLKAEGIFSTMLDPKVAADVFLSINEGFYHKVIGTADTGFAAFRGEARRQLKLLVTGLLSSESSSEKKRTSADNA